MGGIRGLAKGAKALKPFVAAVRGADEHAQRGGAIAVLDGEPMATQRLRAILGVSADQPLGEGTGLLVYGAVEGHDPTLAAAVLAGAKRQGGRVLAIIVGPADIRRRMERVLLAVQPLEPSNVVGVPSLDDPAPIVAAAVRVLDDEAIAAARRHAALRHAVGDMIVSRAARQAGAVGAVAVIPGSDMPAITLVQVRMVAQLAALHGRPLDARRGLEIAGVILSAFGWRALARRAVPVLPVARFAVRGGIGFSATRAIGEAARNYFGQLGDTADEPLDGLESAITTALPRRGRR